MCYMYYTYNMQAQYRITNKHIIKINSKRNDKKIQLKCIYVLCLVKCGIKCKLVRVFTNITASKIACNTIKVNKL